MTELDRQFLEEIHRGIDRERVAEGDSPGWPYSGRELDCAAASALATSVLQAPFHQRRAVLVRLVAGLYRDGFFRLDGGDDTL